MGYKKWRIKKAMREPLNTRKKAKMVIKSTSKSRSSIFLLNFLIGLTLLLTSHIKGAVVSENSQQALQQAMNAGGEVTFGFDGTITLTTPLIATTDVRINGAGRNITISGGFSQTSTNFTGTRILIISPGVNVSLNNIQFTGGVSSNGGAIFVSRSSTLVISNCVFKNNYAIGTNGINGANGNNTISVGGNGGNGQNGGSALGGAIYSEGDLTLISSIFTRNISAGGNGGNGGSGGNGDFAGGNGGNGGNGGMARGGAIYNLGNARIMNCAFNENQALGGSGGNGGTNGIGAVYGRIGQGGIGADGSGAAIFNLGYVEMSGCVFFDNLSQGGNSAQAGSDSSGNGSDGAAGGGGSGGAIANFGTNSSVNCTFYNNQARGGAGGNGGNSFDFIAGDGGNGGSAYGGNYYNNGFGRITNCTFSSGNVIGGTNGVAGQGNFPGRPGNAGFAGGGNIANQGTLILESSIVASSVNGGNIYGAIIDAGYNISSDSTGLNHQTSLKNTDPMLMPLADNGGGTLTMALSLNSPAIDRGNPLSRLTSDQRGTARPYGDAVDIGSYEYPVTKIRGRVTDGTNGIPSVRIASGSKSTYTDSNGYYILSNLTAGSYIVAPEAGGFLFTPSSRIVNAGALSVTNIDFVGTRLLNLGGRITLNGQGLANVTVTANTIYTTITDTNGYYLFSNLPSGNYTIMPTLYGYSFIPETLNVNLQQNATNINFIANQTIFSITGYVLEGSDGVNGVKITIGNLSTYTDINGFFAVSNMSAGVYLVTPSKNGYEFSPPAISVNLNSSTNLMFNAFGIYSVSGKITKNNQPLKGVRVYAGIYSSITDDNGNYTISNLSPRTYRITPVYNGFNFDPPYYEININRDYYNINYIGLNSFAISGAVFSIEPVTGATNGIFTNILISVVNYYSGINGLTNAVDIITTTDTNGTYFITNLNEGIVSITVSNENIKFVNSQTNIYLNSSFSDVNFAGIQLYNIKGKVLFDGKGLSGVRVNAGGLTQLTDAEGIFNFTKFEPTNVVIRPELNGYRFVPQEITITPGIDSTNINFSAFGNLSIGGVITKKGIGVTNVSVFINQYIAYTDVNGYYYLGGLIPGAYEVTPVLSKHIFIPGSTDILLNESNGVVNFIAIPTYNVSGRVTTDGVNGLAGVLISCGSSSAITDESGYYTLLSVPEGTNRITATLENYQFSPVDIVISSNTNEVNFIAIRLFSISGRVIEGARGVSGVIVSAGGISTFSTINGEYILTNVPEGNVVITPQRDGYKFNPESIQINLTNNIMNLNFKAYGALSISGRVTTDGSNGVSGIRISAYGIETITDLNGYYVISNLPPRSITVIPIDDNYLFIPGSTNITLPGANVLNINFLALKFSTISGRVIESGAPKSGVRINCSDGQEIITDENGLFAFPGLLPGNYTVTANLTGHQFEPSSYSITLPPDSTNLIFYSYPLTMTASITNNILLIHIRAKPLGNYILEATDSLNSTGWNSIVPFQTDTNGFIQLIIPTIDKSKPRFYRFRNF